MGTSSSSRPSSSALGSASDSVMSRSASARHPFSISRSTRPRIARRANRELGGTRDQAAEAAWGRRRRLLADSQEIDDLVRVGLPR